MSKLDNIVKQLNKAGFTAHRTTSEANIKVAGRSVYVTAAANGETVRLSLMGKAQPTLAMHMVVITGEPPHVTTHLNSWTIAASKLLPTLKAAEKAAAKHRAKYCKPPIEEA